MRAYVNQVGYLPNSVKTAILAEEAEEQAFSSSMPKKKIKIKVQNVQNAQDTQDGSCVLEKEAAYFGRDADSGDRLWHADFSELNLEGEYRLEAIENETEMIACCEFRIDKNLYGALNQSLCKALYYQRCGMALEEPYAGIFQRKSCHGGKAVLLEDYEKLWKGEIEEICQFEVTGGWHDAGDYGRYTTAAATALAHILYAYQFFPESFCKPLSIPESRNGVPDILNECLYELRWLLKMQMEDGSVCHKLTSMHHANFVMPHEDKRQMILFPASTMAVADFAAIMAKAYRVYKIYDEEFANHAFHAAIKAWNWLEQHPDFIGFENPVECNTGDYLDSSDWDERLWAAVELYRATGEEKYLDAAENFYQKVANPTAMGWSDVGGFAGWALLEGLLCQNQKESGEMAACVSQEAYRKESLQGQYRAAFLREAEKIWQISQKSGYFAALENEDYEWGSNMVLLNRSLVLATAYLLNGEKSYLDAIVRQMDYLLGVNATGYSYVTEVGSHACHNPHNRVTVSDGIDAGIPGFVVGGANAKPADEKAEWLILPDTPPMKCFLDIWECYSLNEITIYWNSPAIFNAAFLHWQRLVEIAKD